MPLEGHWKRVNTPLRRLTPRERRVGLAAFAISVVTVLALVLATVGDSRPGPKPGCIYAIVPGVMGATPVDECGAHAGRTCALHVSLHDPGSKAIRESCRRAGL
ncbi:MAG TPA: hypothetical protein VF032_05300 [Thermoleophilaceae bacterium]